MKIAIILLSFGALSSFTSAAWVSPEQRTFKNGKENRLLEVFSLSFNGNFGISRAIDGIYKIIDGLASCES